MRKSFVMKPAVLCGTLTLLLSLAANQLFADEIDIIDIVVNGETNAYFANGTTETTGSVVVDGNGNKTYFWNGINGGTGTVTTATVATYGGGGYIVNGTGSGSTGVIGTLNAGVFYGYGGFCNGNEGGHGEIDIANVSLSNYSGSSYNGSGSGSTGVIGMLNFNSGVIENGIANGTGIIDIAVLNGGTLHNGANGTGTGVIKTAILNDGAKLYNSYNGGTGSIETLIYNGGSYLAAAGKSSIETLTLNNNKTGSAGEFNKSAIGTVGFGENYGLLTVTANGSFDSFTDSVGIYGNSSATAAIDLTGANVAVNLKGLFADNSGSREAFIEDFGGTLYFADLFSKFSAVTGTDAFASLSILYSDAESDEITPTSLKGWNLGTDEARGAFITYNAKTSAATPEPATVLMFGLGLAGVAALRRRKK
jgi:hypothetical protein